MIFRIVIFLRYLDIDAGYYGITLNDCRFEPIMQKFREDIESKVSVLNDGVTKSTEEYVHAIILNTPPHKVIEYNYIVVTKITVCNCKLSRVHSRTIASTNKDYRNSYIVLQYSTRE